MTHPLTFERVGIKTVLQLVRFQVEQFEDFERWVTQQKDWDTLMQRFVERLASLDGTTFRERKRPPKSQSVAARPCA